MFVSGQVGFDPATGEFVEGGVSEQAERVLKNIAAILDGAGLTMSDVAKTTIFLADIDDFAAVNEVYARHFGDPKPARSHVRSGSPAARRASRDRSHRREGLSAVPFDTPRG